jgi:hypothetical protein
MIILEGKATFHCHTYKDIKNQLSGESDHWLETRR